MTGVEFRPPPPMLSADLVQPLDAVLSQRQGVFPDNNTPPLPDSTTPENPAWLPVPPVSPPKEDPAKPWEHVQALWTAPGLGAGAAAVAAGAWARAMGWADKSVSGRVPERLVAGLQTLYVAAPLVAVAAS
jgi:hypothetical protein